MTMIVVPTIGMALTAIIARHYTTPAASALIIMAYVVTWAATSWAWRHRPQRRTTITRSTPPTWQPGDDLVDITSLGDPGPVYVDQRHGHVIRCWDYWGWVDPDETAPLDRRTP